MLAYSLGEVWHLVMSFLSLINWEVVILAGLAGITWFYARQTAVIARETKNLATQTLKLADETTRMAGATVKMAKFSERAYMRSMRPELNIEAPAPGQMTTPETDEYTSSYMVTNGGGTAVVLKSIEGVVGSTLVQNTIDHFLHPHANFPAVLSWEIGLGNSVPRRVQLYAADIAGNVHEWKLSGE